MTTTFAEAINAAEQVSRRAKQAAEVARLRRKAAPADPELRVAASAAADAASEAGREVQRLQFEQELDRWIDRRADYQVVTDENLELLAPSDSAASKYPDMYWLAAAHLLAAGWSVPKGWRSPVSGEPVHEHHPKSSAKSSGPSTTPR
jgi:hypothetical protein